jgi:sulfur transfer complex TusBCD TusB component (DsrH family)
LSNYLIIEARDPFDSADVANAHALAAGLVDEGSTVTMYLVQNGVMPARAGSSAAGDLTSLAGKVAVLADDFSLRERGITQLADGVSESNVDALVDMLADGRKVIWH